MNDEAPQTTTNATMEACCRLDTAFIATELAWLMVVGLLLPVCAAKWLKNDKPDLRGLNLPRGSVRSILALAIVGSFVIFLVFMPFLSAETTLLQSALAAFATLSGAVTGFYFGGRSAAPPPPQ